MRRRAHRTRAIRASGRPGADALACSRWCLIVAGVPWGRRRVWTAWRRVAPAGRTRHGAVGAPAEPAGTEHASALSARPSRGAVARPDPGAGGAGEPWSPIDAASLSALEQRSELSGCGPVQRPGTSTARTRLPGHRGRARCESRHRGRELPELPSLDRRSHPSSSRATPYSNSAPVSAPLQGCTRMGARYWPPTSQIECVAALEQRFAGSPNVTVAKKDLRELGDEGARFDSIVMVNVLEHIEDDAGALASIGKLLAPRGRIIVYVPGAQRPLRPLGPEGGSFPPAIRNGAFARLLARPDSASSTYAMSTSWRSRHGSRSRRPTSSAHRARA